MNVVFTIDFTGTPDAEDVLAARHAIFIENRVRSQQTPPGTQLPTATPAQVKSSYLAVLAQMLNTRHLTNASDAATEAGISQRFTPAQVAQMHANLVARLNAGESAATIIADTAA